MTIIATKILGIVVAVIAVLAGIDDTIAAKWRHGRIHRWRTLTGVPALRAGSQKGHQKEQSTHDVKASGSTRLAPLKAVICCQFCAHCSQT